MWEEDYPVAEYRNPSEPHQFLFLVMLMAVTTWNFGGGTQLSLVVLSAFIFVPVALFINRCVMGFEDTSTPRRDFILVNLPAFLAIVIAYIGYLNPLLAYSEDNTLISFAKSSAVLPTTTQEIYLPLQAFARSALFCCAASIVLVADSQYLIRRVLIVFCLNASVLAMFGILQELFSLERIFGFVLVDNPFFSTFPQPALWAGYALIWSVVATGMILQEIVAKGIRMYITQGGIWFSILYATLIGSVFASGTPFHLILMGVLSVCFGLYLLWFLLGYLKKMQSRLIYMTVVLLVTSACALLTYDYALSEVKAIAEAHPEVPRMPAGIPAHIHKGLITDTLRLIGERPWFGWGTGSFASVMALTQQVDLDGRHYISPNSSLLLFVFEEGLAGVILWVSVPLFFTFKFFLLKRRRTISYFMLAAALTGLAAGSFSFALETPASALSCWLLFFCGYRWSKLDQPSTFQPQRSTVVFTHEEMQILPRVQKSFDDRRSQPRTRRTR